MRTQVVTHFLLLAVGFLAFFVKHLSLIAAEPAAPQMVTVAGVENVFAVSERILSGGTPQNAAAFEQLQKLGVTTILSVDGAPPDVKTAKLYGLRYIHLPIGYDGISSTRQAEMLKALQETEGKLFVHCHHGKHRGPAAASILERLANGWSNDQTRQYMAQAGTSPNYQGLWRSVAECRIPSMETMATLSKKLPESVAPPPLVETMLRIDEHWEPLLPLVKGNSEPTREQYQKMSASLLLLREQNKEWMREKEFSSQPQLFQKAAANMLIAADDLAQKLRNEQTSFADLQAAAKLVAQECTACHTRYRDQR